MAGFSDVTEFVCDYPNCIGRDGSPAHSDIDASYTATFSYPSRVNIKASLLAAIPPPQ